MAKRKKEQLREERIDNEVVVDAYGPEERAMGWYYYLESKIRFPFQAQCIAAKTISPLLKGEKAEVRRMAPEDACSGDIRHSLRGPAAGCCLYQRAAGSGHRPGAAARAGRQTGRGRFRSGHAGSASSEGHLPVTHS